MNTVSLPLNCWAAEDIPSNKAESMGYGSLTNTELLSILIGSGKRECNAVETARKLLFKSDNNLKTLARMRSDQMASVDGIGKQKAARIMACLELGRRMNFEQAETPNELTTATRIYNHMAPRIADLNHEEFWVIFLNQRFGEIKTKRVSQGGLTETAVDVRVIMREALLNNATVIAACHNHPSGNLRPSKADDELTQAIKKACECMRVKFIDHVIVTNGNYYSYHEEGIL